MRAVTLFAGAGGADVGMAQAGVEHVRCIEYDEHAAATLGAAGFPAVHGDVRDLSLYEGLGHIDLMWASPPCQDWSAAGNREGAKGDRNGWPWTFDVLDHLAARGDGPRWLLAENVTGLTTHVGECPTRDGKPQDDPESCPRCYLDHVIMPQLRARFTWAEWRILDAADYGVPQRRRRVIIAAGPHPIAWPEATHSGEALAKAKWVTKDYWRAVGVAELGEPSAQESRWLKQRGQLGLFAAEPRRFGLRPWRTVRQALGLAAIAPATRNSGSTPPGVPQSADLPGIQPVAGGKALGGLYGWDQLATLETRAGSQPWRIDRPSPCVSAVGESKGSGEGGNPEKIQRASDALFLATGRRRLTPQECARLQDFPDDHPWQGTKTAIYRQIGNAVPPTLARAVTQAVLRAWAFAR